MPDTPLLNVPMPNTPLLNVPMPDTPLLNVPMPNTPLPNTSLSFPRNVIRSIMIDGNFSDCDMSTTHEGMIQLHIHQPFQMLDVNLMQDSILSRYIPPEFQVLVCDDVVNLCVLYGSEPHHYIPHPTVYVEIDYGNDNGDEHNNSGNGSDDHKQGSQDLTLVPFPLTLLIDEYIAKLPKLSEPYLYDLYIAAEDFEHIRSIGFLLGGNFIQNIRRAWMMHRIRPVRQNEKSYYKIPFLLILGTVFSQYVDAEIRVQLMKPYSSFNLWKSKVSSNIPLDHTKRLTSTLFDQVRVECTIDQFSGRIFSHPNLYLNRIMFVLMDGEKVVQPKTDERGVILHPIRSIDLSSLPPQGPLPPSPYPDVYGDGDFYYKLIPTLYGEGIPSQGLIYQYIIHPTDFQRTILDANYIKPPPLTPPIRMVWDVDVYWNKDVLLTHYPNRTLRLVVYVEKQNELRSVEGSAILRYSL